MLRPLVAALVTVTCAGCSPSPGELTAVPSSTQSSAQPTAQPSASGRPSAQPSARPPEPVFAAVREVSRAASPVRLRIPSIAVDAAVGRVGTAADGTVEVPTRWEDIGWFDEGVRPGDKGPAVLLGHVDSKAGPAVFARLPQVAVGATVEVIGDGGGTTRWRVERIEQHPKEQFPTEAVYLPTLRPELRLVTCGGVFDRSTGHYRDNIVVHAALIGA